jgi:hypothetical protein
MPAADPAVAITGIAIAAVRSRATDSPGRSLLSAHCRADADGNEMRAAAVEQERREQTIRVSSSSIAALLASCCF